LNKYNIYVDTPLMVALRNSKLDVFVSSWKYVLILIFLIPKLKLIFT